MLNHIPFAKLADLAEGTLASEERNAVMAHASSCSRCSARLAQLQGVITNMRADNSQDAPRDLIQNAITLFETRRSVAKTPLAQRILAALSFDSFQNAPAFAVRGGQSDTRQLLYSAGDYDLDLRIAQSGQTWKLSGQLLGAGCAGGSIEIKSEAAVAQAALNDQCEFVFSEIPSGSYDLHLSLSNLEIDIPPLQLGA